MSQPFRTAPAAAWQARLSKPSRPALPAPAIVGIVGGALALALVLGAALLVAKGAQPSTTPPPSDVADWTVLVYMDGDNNLESVALNDLRHMARVGSSAQVAIVAQIDRLASKNLWDDTTAGNWVGTRRFLVQPGMEPDAAAAVQDLGEVSTGDPNTLATFLTWGVSHYPARHYALVLWSHGAAWQGLTIDDPGEGNLTLPRLRTALALAQARAGYDKLDLIGFDACMMGQLDVLQTIVPYARVAVASADLEPTQGWDWDVWLEALAANPGQDAYALAPAIVDSYIRSYEQTDDVTLTAFDLAQIDHVSAQLDRLAGALLQGTPADYASVARTRSLVREYAPGDAEEYHAVDLGHFAQLLAAQGAAGEVAAEAEALERAIQQARLAYGASQGYRDLSGISVYFPPTAAQYLPSYERDSPLPRLTRWAAFLKAYHHSLELTR